MQPTIPPPLDMLERLHRLALALRGRSIIVETRYMRPVPKPFSAPESPLVEVWLRNEDRDGQGVKLCQAAPNEAIATAYALLRGEALELVKEIAASCGPDLDDFAELLPAPGARHLEAIRCAVATAHLEQLGATDRRCRCECGCEALTEEGRFLCAPCFERFNAEDGCWGPNPDEAKRKLAAAKLADRGGK